MEGSTKQILIDIASGKLPVEAVNPGYGAPGEFLLDYDLCTGIELERLLQTVKSLGHEIDKWPEAEKSYLNWLKEDVADRLPRTGFSERKRFSCNHLPGELMVIKYKDPAKAPLFQLELGWNQAAHPTVTYPDHNKYFVHYDLRKWRSDIQFDQLSEKELEQTCIQLITEKELLNP